MADNQMDEYEAQNLQRMRTGDIMSLHTPFILMKVPGEMVALYLRQRI